jgi:hypothetical protein
LPLWLHDHCRKLLACVAWQYFCALNGINGLKPDDTQSASWAKTLDRRLGVVETDELPKVIQRLAPRTCVRVPYRGGDLARG